MGFKFPQREIVLLALESDIWCTSWRGHSARKSALLVVVWCYKTRGDREHDLGRYWWPEGCIKQRYDKPGIMVASVRSMSWGSNEAVSLLYLVPWPSTRTYRGKTQYSEWKHNIRNIPDSHHSQYSSFTQQITLCYLYCFSGLCTICRVVLLLIYDLATKIRSCLVLGPLPIMHILGFITLNFLPIGLMIVAALTILLAWIWMWVGIGKCLIFVQIRHVFRLFVF